MKIAVLLSGGVDSSVALRLLREEGHELTAFYLKIWLEEELSFLGQCPWEDDLKFARATCRQLGVPLEVLSLQREYRERVVDFALSELRAGRTPSPDIFCNRWIKFGEFLTRVAPEGFDKMATGHYAQVGRAGDQWVLRQSPDRVKDQTYFLSQLTQRQLSHSLFPLGGLRKPEVRRLADRYRLPSRDRPDSQGICFLGRIKYAEFVRQHLGEREGPIVEAETGATLGRHRGVWFHTIGQRQGLGLSGGPWYVVDREVGGNVLRVSHSSRYLERARREFQIASPHWVGGEPVGGRLSVKLRHGPSMTGCELERGPADRWNVHLDEADAGIAAGQFGVFYHHDVCLGGGVIADSPLEAE